MATKWLLKTVPVESEYEAVYTESFTCNGVAYTGITVSSTKLVYEGDNPTTIYADGQYADLNYRAIELDDEPIPSSAWLSWLNLRADPVYPDMESLNGYVWIARPVSLLEFSVGPSDLILKMPVTLGDGSTSNDFCFAGKDSTYGSSGLYYGTELAYEGTAEKWMDEKYCRVYFDGEGRDSSNQFFIYYLYLNGQLLPASTEITDLTRYTWNANSKLMLEQLGTFSYNINFTAESGSSSWTYMKMGTAGGLSYEGTTAFDLDNGWTREGYQSINIVDGDEVTNVFLIAWLVANGALSPTVSDNVHVYYGSTQIGQYTLTAPIEVRYNEQVIGYLATTTQLKLLCASKLMGHDVIITDSGSPSKTIKTLKTSGKLCSNAITIQLD